MRYDYLYGNHRIDKRIASLPDSTRRSTTVHG